MRRLYEKNELTFALVWIVIYCVLQSFANPLNEKIGIEYSASAIFCILQSVILLVFIRKNNLLKWYGLFCFAIAVGFLLVTIFYRGGSLLPCIFTHSAINILSTFANEVGFTVEKQIIHVFIMIVLTVAYTLILMKTFPQR